MANIATHLFARALDSAQKTALIFGSLRLSFAQLHSQVCHLAAALSEAGFGADDKLGLMLPSGPEFITFEYAAFTLGGVVVPLNVHYQGNEIEHALSSCEVEFLTIHAQFLPRLTTEVLDRLPALRRVFVLGDAADRVCGRVVAANTLLRHDKALSCLTERLADDVALMLHTSATTGKAKGVMLTVGNLQANYDKTPEWLGITGRDRILCALPLYNTFGLNQCINAMMVTGATLVLVPRFDVRACLQAIQAHRCSFLPAVPTMVQKMLNDPGVSQFDLTSVQRLLIGAAPVPAPLLEQVYRIMGPDTVVMTGYGLTEASALVSLERTTLDEQGRLHRPRSVGQVLPGMQMQVSDENGLELPPGQVGQICIKGPNVMRGYYRHPEQTAQAIVNGWLQTGDLGVMDAERHFYIVDRKKDLIIRGGQNVYPADIEEVLYGHPAVAEAAAVGKPHDVLGEVPEAFVALKPGCNATAPELMALCQSRLAYFKVPQEICILHELPKGPTGKILRRELRASADALR